MGHSERILGFVAALLATATAVPAQADSGCKVAKFADLPTIISGNSALVDVKFGPHPTRMIVDSGAFYSTISRATAVEFNLKTVPAPSWFRVQGVNGDAAVSIAEAQNFTLADIPLRTAGFFVGGSETGAAGLLGQDVLGLQDVEYDLPHSIIRLMHVMGCKGVALAYWVEGKPFSAVELERGDGGPWRPSTIGTVMVNGVKMRALFDSGAQSSVMTLAAAKRAGITPDSPGVERTVDTVGLGSGHVASWIAPFDSIDIGGEIIPRPRFTISAINLDVDMLIGFDFFLTHRVFVSNATHRLYMTYEGGPLFGIKPSGARKATGEALDLTDKSGEPTDAAGFARRGANLLSKNKSAEGMADLDKAIALAPDNGHYRFMRAQAHLDADDDTKAKADLDKAVELLPDDSDVRMVRATLRIAKHDQDGAIADLKVADAHLAAGSDKRLALAELFSSVDLSEESLANADAWLQLHRDDVNSATGYNARCWSRALLNRELKQALSDCNMALRLRPGTLAYLDSRALVRLRLGQLDDALKDYDALLKADPHIAWSLYMRAVAERRVGRGDKGVADHKAALAIDADVVKRAAKLGLSYDAPMP